jgi:hypothetical protein
MQYHISFFFFISPRFKKTIVGVEFIQQRKKVNEKWAWMVGMLEKMREGGRRK